MVRAAPQRKGLHRLDPEAEGKALRALDLAMMGRTYEQIALIVGYTSRGVAHKAVQRQLARVRSPKVDEYRTVNTLRLEQLLATVLPIATDPTNKSHLWATDRALVIIASLNKLHGLDVPVVQQVQTEGALTVRFVNDWRGGGAVVEASRDGGPSSALEADTSDDDDDATGE